VGEQIRALDAPLVANGAGTTSVGGPGSGVTVLEFFASWCGSCSSLVPPTERVVLARGARWVAVSVDDTPEAALGAARRWGLRGAVVHDRGRRLHDTYRVTAVPSLVVLRADGSVAFSAVGSVPEPELLRRIDEAEAPRQ
jgi:cytochrome c biogenesis protein CcmG/thiol:disulfide interchange protein DsbE